jgi:hypothetical protein
MNGSDRPVAVPDEINPFRQARAHKVRPNNGL